MEDFPPNLGQDCDSNWVLKFLNQVLHLRICFSQVSFPVLVPQTLHLGAGLSTYYIHTPHSTLFERAGYWDSKCPRQISRVRDCKWSSSSGSPIHLTGFFICLHEASLLLYSISLKEPSSTHFKVDWLCFLQIFKLLLLIVSQRTHAVSTRVDRAKHKCRLTRRNQNVVFN